MAETLERAPADDDGRVAERGPETAPLTPLDIDSRSSSLVCASILAALKAAGCDAAGLSYSVNDGRFSASRVVADILESAPDEAMVAFGVFISYVAGGLEKLYPLADVFIRGYAEESLCELSSAEERKPTIVGVHYAGDPDLGLKSETKDLASAASPYISGVIQPQKFIRLETQRGCPFRCNFCQHRSAESRYRPERFEDSRVRSEIELLVRSGVVEDIAVLDPTFNAPKSGYLGYIALFAELGYSGRLRSRFELVKDEYLDAVCRLNRTGHVLLEFGLQTTHRAEAAAIQRPNNMKKVAETIAKLQDRGIDFEVSLIFGLPLQTIASFSASVQELLDLGAPTIKAFPLMLLRGTELQVQGPEKYGLVESRTEGALCASLDRSHGGGDNIPVVVQSNSFTHDDWRRMNDIANALAATEHRHPRTVNDLLLAEAPSFPIE
ncbi:hypothetical protein M885DRAFT_616816 [Pelagophyceae sp. CCMP2097]|nr:hypothetical protein M885DRAFT_616816 [Pelagophyceae sp. CCMP2097]